MNAIGFGGDRIIRLALVAVALEPFGGGVIVLRLAEEFERTVWGAYCGGETVARDQQIGRRDEPGERDADQQRGKSEPAPIGSP